LIEVVLYKYLDLWKSAEELHPHVEGHGIDGPAMVGTIQ
jgi:hypothetical protein